MKKSDPDPGSRIWDKHSGSATLFLCFRIKNEESNWDPHDSLSAPLSCLNMLLQRCAAPLLLPAVEAGVLVLGMRSAHVLPRQRNGDQDLAEGAGLLRLPLIQLLHPPHLQGKGYTFNESEANSGFVGLIARTFTA